MATANVAEVFSGIQGEGMLVGERQIFVRFCGCNLRCSYCDTKWAWEKHNDCRVERIPGSAAFVFVRNPLDPARLISILADLRGGPDLHHSLCLTGGEPLTQAKFLAEFLPGARSLFPMTYLETNGTLSDELAGIIDLIDIVSMDIKIPSASGVKADMEAHRRFLLVAMRTSVYVKIVICGKTPAEEIHEAALLISAVDRGIPLVLQPAMTPQGLDAPPARQLLRFQALAREDLDTVRVIPQTHKIMGLL